MVAIGNTGSGKSTLLASLLNGSGTLEERYYTHTYFKPMPDRTMKRIELKKKVIDFVDE